VRGERRLDAAKGGTGADGEERRGGGGNARGGRDTRDRILVTTAYECRPMNVCFAGRGCVQIPSRSGPVPLGGPVGAAAACMLVSPAVLQPRVWRYVAACSLFCALPVSSSLCSAALAERAKGKEQRPRAQRTNGATSFPGNGRETANTYTNAQEDRRNGGRIVHTLCFCVLCVCFLVDVTRLAQPARRS